MADLFVCLTFDHDNTSALISRNEALKIGDVVGLTADAERLHMFDAQTGVSLRKT